MSKYAFSLVGRGAREVSVAVATLLGALACSAAGGENALGAGADPSKPTTGTGGAAGEEPPDIILPGPGGSDGGTTQDPCDVEKPPTGCLVAAKPACGDGKLNQPGVEACDDGNSLPGDGCSGICQLEPDWVCPTPGERCKSSFVCGNRIRERLETCDDGNTKDGDGCSSGCDAVEPNFACPHEGEPCERLARCGDGVVSGQETCDDGNTSPADGCSTECRWEEGWACTGDAGKYSCQRTSCGDKILGNLEACDDGNPLPFDGCSRCKLEPSCPREGACTSSCGDGLVILPEQCDDGNRRSRDGCSSTCAFEPGFTCEKPAAPNQLDVPVVFRDFIGQGKQTGGYGEVSPHPNFERTGDADIVVTNMVESLLDAEGKPVMVSSPPKGAALTNAADFRSWYRDEPKYNRTFADTLTLTRSGANAFVFEAPMFFPVDDRGFVSMGYEAAYGGAKTAPPYDNNWSWHPGTRNFSFSSEVRYWFTYDGDHALTFLGDDDVWVFVNGRLALDLGGIHSPKTATLTLTAANAKTYGLELGKVYEIAVFQAERHVEVSSYKLTLSGFDSAPTRCKTLCGDGILVEGVEQCDDGKLDGTYGGCTKECRAAAHCGDGHTDAGFEDCDDGKNDGGYGECGVGCKFGPYCGDGHTDAGVEDCDDGKNDGGYGECGAGCKLGPHCGDGHLDAAHEDCDDGNSSDHDGCSAACRIEIVIR